MKINNLFISRMKYTKKVNEGSVAGNVVQRQIFDDLVANDQKSFFLSFQPYPSWPKGPLIVKGIKDDKGYFVPYLNLYIIREIIFCLYIIFFSIKVKNIFQYNSYFFQNLVLFLMQNIFLKKVVCIFQDYKSGDSFSLKDRIYDKLSSYFLKYFDCNIVVSDALAKELSLKKYFVFQGALTYVAKKNNINNESIVEEAIYAGALEKHNGIDILVKEWSNQCIQLPLNVYGRGGLYSELKKYESEFIKIHGFKNVEEVNNMMSHAKINFCLRYSRGINQNFFFPSKFFNLCAYPGYLIVNNFNNLPSDLSSSLIFVDDELTNLKKIVDSIELYDVEKRRTFIKQYTWYNCLNKVFSEYLI